MPMTAKERQKVERLEMENDSLREAIRHHMDVYGSCLIEIIELKAKLSLVESAIYGNEK